MTDTPSLQEAAKALQKQEFDRAASLLGGILAQQPDTAQARLMLMQCHHARRDRDGVLAQLRALLGQASINLSDIHLLARFAYHNGYPLDEIINTSEAYAARQPDSANAVFNLAYYLAWDAQYERAVEKYREAIKQGVRAPEEAELNIASIYMDHLHDTEQAAKHLERARALNPRFAAVYHNLGNLAEQLGDRARAAHYFEKCLELDPRNEAALARLADSHRFESKNDPVLQRVVAAVPGSSGRDLHFSLGRAYDQLADYEKAWQHFAHANRLDAAAFPPYIPDEAERHFAAIKAVCDAEWMARATGESQAPVFVCGLFRSGSTLLEQMLGAHPGFTPGGELQFFPRLLARHFPYYPEGLANVATQDTAEWRAAHRRLSERLTEGRTRLIDKRPDNFLYIGLIKAVLPNAKFVVTERDWRDTAISIFATRLGVRQNYSTDLANIGHYIGLHRDLVDHWADLLGGDLVRVQYEELVSEPRTVLGELLERLGEEWSDDCLDFHARRAAVKTASVWQVREPLHSRSVGRWKNYSTVVGKAFDS